MTTDRERQGRPGELAASAHVSGGNLPLQVPVTGNHPKLRISDRMTKATLPSLLLLGGCAVKDAHFAHEAETRLIGLSEVDLGSCLGVPDQHSSFGDTDILTYYATSTSNDSYSIPIIGGMSFGNGGYCHTTFHSRISASRKSSIPRRRTRPGHRTPIAHRSCALVWHIICGSSRLPRRLRLPRPPRHQLPDENTYSDVAGRVL